MALIPQIPISGTYLFGQAIRLIFESIGAIADAHLLRGKSMCRLKRYIISIGRKISLLLEVETINYTGIQND